MARLTILLLAAGAGLAACTYGDGHAYHGGEWDGPREPHRGELRGAGVEILDPWLKETDEGRAIVTLGFRDAAYGEISEDIAHRANIWFRRYADSNRDMRVTDEEIRTALVAAGGRYLRR